MSFAPRQEYRISELYKLTIYDVRIPGVAERLHCERGAWLGEAAIKALDEDHFVLITWPGGTQGLAL